ncbi:MAG: type II toxin-antitoxin system RelB/DinJ family antitoxin [Deltaproteobacteria bacterium]|nr:type II toxin-antitoxin system RelB/DinJ family antitoxin [Candidatus Tharpella aukensis]
MRARKQTSIRVDPVAWNRAKEIFEEYNLTLSDAINIFLNKVRLEGGMPFEIKLPSQRLQTAMLEADKNRGTFHETADDLMHDLKQ